jgi:putative nucleotidyltransferase with HDIG domain
MQVTCAFQKDGPMDAAPRLQSLFSQKLDRSVFATYFLGAVVPLLALAGVVREYVVPALRDEDFGMAGVMGLVVGIGVLSLASFLALRRITRGAVERMDADNRRLAELLQVARELSEAPHSSAVSETACRSALELCHARGAYVVLRPEPDKPIALHESAGEHAQALFQAHEGQLVELAERALAESRPVWLEEGGRRRRGAKVTLTAAAAVPLRSHAGPAGALVLVSTEPGGRFSREAIDANATLAALTVVALDNVDLKEAQRNFFTYGTEMIVAALDAHVDTRRGHATQVARLSNRIGRELGLDESGLERLHFGALLHDIGMLKIDRSQHRDPAFYRNHPKLGHRMLSRVRLWRGVAPVVLHHHERYDGSGYPEGLQADRIPLEARIVSVADAFDAMTRDDGPRRAKSFDEAVAELRSEQGRQFDPKVVDVFVRLVERGDISLESR